MPAQPTREGLHVALQPALDRRVQGLMDVDRRSIGLWLVLVLIVGVIIARPGQARDLWSREAWETWVAERQVAALIVELQRLDAEVSELQRRLVEAHDRVERARRI